MFDNGSEFIREFTPLLKFFDIKPALTPVNDPKANNPEERVHQVILNMLATKDLNNKIFEYIDSWGETLVSIAQVIRASYRRTIIAMPVQSVSGRDMLFNLMSLID